MFESWVWGPVPGGYRRVFLPAGSLMVVQKGVDAAALGDSVLFHGALPGEQSAHYGRGPLRRIRIAGDNVALVRQYRHGGLLRNITRDAFVTWPARPFMELVVTEEVRRRGIPTVDVLAAVVERIWGPLYRGWLVSRELTGAEDLWLVLKRGPTREEMGRLVRAVAKGIRQMHREGVYHADLNLKNILVRRQGRRIDVFLIDLDRARLYVNELSSRQANRVLLRLLRSVRKLDSGGRYFSDADWAHFMKCYDQAPPP